MKKVLALFAASVIGTTTLVAQETPSSSEGVRFGIKLSPNMGFIRPDSKDLASNGSGFGYTFGLLSEFPIGAEGNYRFATGVFLNNIVGKWTQEYTYVDNIGEPNKTKGLETDVKLQYIELPLTIKMMTNEIGYMRYFGQVGFGNAINISAKANIEVPTVTGTDNGTGSPVVSGFTTSDDEDLQNDIMLYKASLIVGGGLEYNFSGNTSLLVGVTYNSGFTNILDIEGEKAKANYLELTLGVFF